jgi:putative oxidoreductase
MTVTLNLGLLLLRVVCGLTLAAHGSQKLFGWFGGSGFAKQREGMAKQGYKPALLWAFFVVLGEVGGGLSLAFGLLTPLGAAGIVGSMVMAIFKVHWKNGFWNGKRGIEFPLSLLTIATAIGIMGPGDYSLDALLNIALPSPLLFGILAAAAVVVDSVGMLMTRPTATPASPPSPASPGPAQPGTA